MTHWDWTAPPPGWDPVNPVGRRRRRAAGATRVHAPADARIRDHDRPPGVVLGFGDGSQVRLPAHDAVADRLRALADELTRRP